MHWSKVTPWQDRFWTSVENRGGEGCWPWIGGKDDRGYGKASVGGQKWKRAPRVAWELTNGPIPDGLHVLHRCDNPPCVNPAHLFLGTNRDNHADKVAKGRQARGERCGHNKLTEDDVVAIRYAVVVCGARQRELSRALGVSAQTVCNVVNRSSWREAA